MANDDTAQDQTAYDQLGLTPQQRSLIGYNTIGSIGALLLAAGQKMSPQDRAKYLAQLGNVPTQMSQQIDAATQGRVRQQQLAQIAAQAALMKAQTANLPIEAQFKQAQAAEANARVSLTQAQAAAAQRSNDYAESVRKIMQGPEFQARIDDMAPSFRETARAMAANGSPEAYARLQEWLTPTIDQNGNYTIRATGELGNIYTGQSYRMGPNGLAPMQSTLVAPISPPAAGQVPISPPAAGQVPIAAPVANGTRAEATPPAAGQAPQGESRFNEAVLANVAPAIANQVRAIARGDEEIPEGRAGQAGLGMQLRSLVALYDPNGYSNILNGVRRKISQDFSPSGNGGALIASAEKIINHVVNLQEAASDLGNGQYPIINEIRNLYREHTGDSKITNFDQWRTAVAEELGKFLRGGGQLTDSQVKLMQQDISKIQSPDQLQQAIDNVFELMQGQLRPKLAQYEAAMGRPYNGGQPFSQETRDRLAYIDAHPVPGSQKALAMEKARAAAAAGATPAAPGAGPAQAPAPAISLPPEARAALKENQVTTFRNGTKWMLRNGQPVQVQ